MPKKLLHALACALGLGLWFEKENLEKKPPLYVAINVDLPYAKEP
jgi:hypothetical protein